MPSFLDQFKTFWAGLDPVRRRVLVGATGTALLAVVGVGLWAGQPAYVDLTSPSSTDEQQIITEALARAEIPYRIREGVIQVQALDEVRARQAAATENGIVGLDGLDQLNPWVTPFQEILHKQRMMQGELVRAINAFDGVMASNVLLNLPQRSEFLRDEARSTAAVSIRMDSGRSLSRDTARSIAEFVSKAVSGMTKDDVTVVDTNTGRTVWNGSKDPMETAGGEVAAQSLRQSEQLQEGLRQALTRALGSPSAFTVTVQVDLTSSSTQSTSTQVDPNSGVASRERIDTETNASSNTTGAPGADTNLPEPTPTSGTGSSGKKDSTETTYLYNTTQTTVVQPAGEVRRLSASVMVDQAVVAALVEKAGNGMTPEQFQKDLERQIQGALGYSETRGDQVVVSFLRFADEPMAEAELTASTPVWMQLVPAGIAALAVGFVFLFVVRPMMRRIREEGATATAGELEAAAANASGAANTQLIPGFEDDDYNLADRLKNYIDNFQQPTPHELSELVRRESNSSSEVVRRWMRG